MLKPRLKDFEHNFTSMGDECNCPVVWTFFSTTLLGNWDEDGLFPVLWPLLFQFCWHIECSTLIASTFRLLNSSVGIPSPPIVLLAILLLRPTWRHTLECLALSEWRHHCGYPGHENLFCTVLCILVTSFWSLLLLLGITVSVLYCAYLCMKCSFDISNYLKEISHLSPSVFSSIALHCSLKKVFLSLLAVFWNSAFSLV